MAYTDVFGGSSIQATDVQFAAVTLSASITTAWPPYATGAIQPLARIMKVAATAASLSISLPDATKSGTGQDVLVDNSGANTFTVLDFAGGVVATLTPGQVKYLYLSDASTQPGTWRVTIFGVGASTLDASALAGYGVKAIANTINTAAVATVIGGNTTVALTDRSKVFVWNGASGTLTLPTTIGSTSDFGIEVRNQGTGTLTLAPVGGVLIDASASITLSVGESCFVHMGATDWYTVGRGRNTAFNFTQLSKATTGGTTVLTLTEASNVVQKYTGTLLSNAIITLPAVVQVYYVSNATAGAFTLTFACAGGGTSVAVTQGQAAILFCDGTNIVNANTSLAGGISAIIFAGGTVTTPSVAIATSTTGFYSSGTNEIGITSNGVFVGKFSSAGYTGAVVGAEFLTNKDASNGYAGLTLYKVNFKNAANTFTSYLTNTNTAARTYTYPDKDGTVAMTVDILGGTLAGSFTTLSATGAATFATNVFLTDTNRFIAASANSLLIGADGASGTVALRANGATIATVSSTGLAVTGVVTATADIRARGAAGTAMAGTIGMALGGTTPGLSFEGTANPWLIYKNGDSLRVFRNTSSLDVAVFTSGGLTVLGEMTVTSVARLGYDVGAGGTVTQATSKSTTVTLNKPCGQITTTADALAAGAAASFVVSNTLLSPADVVLLTMSGSTVNASSYSLKVPYSQGGGFAVKITNDSGGSLSDSIIFNFTVIKGSAS